MKNYLSWKWLYRLHRDERGNLGVLLLMIILSLFGLMGLIWNSSEFGTRRQNVQNAADSAAHAAQSWVARSCNLISATQMLMCENGSAQVIQASVVPTATAVQSRLNSEQATANRLLTGNQPGVPEVNIPDVEYFEELLGFGPWTNNGEGTTLLTDFNNLQTQINALLPTQTPAFKVQMTAALRRDQIGLTWLQNTWVLGQPPQSANEPGPPGGNGQGLQQMVSSWIENQVKPRLTAILTSIPQQQVPLDQFSNRAGPGLTVVSAATLQQRRDAMFDYEHTVTGMVPDVVEEQRAKLATTYNCDVTVALPNSQGPSTGPARITPPLEDADVPMTQTHSDPLRTEYSDAAIARFGTDSPSLTIDPINVNTGDSTIWHPGVPISGSYPIPVGNNTVEYDYTEIPVAGGEFGQVYCAPLATYFNQRVWRDAAGLATYMTALDNIRAALRSQIYPCPQAPQIPNAPPTIPDPIQNNPAIPIPPGALPTLVPAGTAAQRAAITALNTQITAFNTRVTNYSNQLRNLNSILSNLNSQLNDSAGLFGSISYGFIDSASQNFAYNTWFSNVDANRVATLQDFGSLKQFMVLKTYALHPIPDWAKSGMYTSAQQYIYNKVYSNDISGMTWTMYNAVRQWLIGQRVSQGVASTIAQGVAPGMAQQIVSQGATIISNEVAQEWIQREWPYEITPPEVQVPPTRGMNDDDRKNYFTLLAAAKTNSTSGPKLVLPRFFGSSGAPMVAYAQAETFNWMEFNGTFGGADRFDQVTNQGWNIATGSPACWRLCSIGGWNWNPRLAFSDALAPALQNNPELSDYFNQSGLTGNWSDPNASSTIGKLSDH